jgi:transketolase
MALGSSEHFINSALKFQGISVIWTPRTKTTDFRGDRTFVNSDNITITAVLHRNKQTDSPDKQGETNNRTGYLMYKPENDIKKDDLITYGSEVWQVTQVVKRGPGDTVSIYGYAYIFLTNA